jgi:DNA modification methylase
MADYSEFHALLNQVWEKCFNALVPGGRLVVVVGDVCLSRRKNGGRHVVVPLHAAVQENCMRIGFDPVAPIVWYKIANASYEAGGGGFLGKPYEPNAVIKNDVEWILMFRKPGGYRSPTDSERALSIIGEENHRVWFQQIWTGITGASTRNHPAPFPETLATRLIRMFSFVGDTVIDPFLGTGTTSLAAWRAGRSSFGIELDANYFKFAVDRFRRESSMLGSTHKIIVENANKHQCV